MFPKKSFGKMLRMPHLTVPHIEHQIDTAVAQGGIIGKAKTIEKRGKSALQALPGTPMHPGIPKGRAKRIRGF